MLQLSDIKTLCFISSIISLVLCINMIYVAKTRKTFSGFSQWTTASILYSLGLALMGMRNDLPEFVSIIAANTLIILGSSLIAYGLELFTNSTRKLWLFLASILTTFLFCLYFTYYYPSVNARIIVMSSILAIIYGYSGYIVYKNIPHLLNDTNNFLVTVFGLQSLWNVFRIIQTVFYEKPVVDFMNASMFQAMTIAVFFLGNVFVVIGLIILNFQKVEYDLMIMTEEVKTLRGIIPICAYCKKIRDDKGAWNQLEAYVANHTLAKFSHGICPECLQNEYKNLEDD